MMRVPDVAAARGVSTAELEAMSALREIREHGGYVLLDFRGDIHIRHIARVPVELKKRVALFYREIVRLLLESVQ
jgi:hypothetical protein